MKPERITLSRAKGWRMPENTVKVDRTTVFGNPYQAGKDGDGSPEYLVGCFRKQMDRDKHEMPQEFYDWIKVRWIPPHLRFIFNPFNHTKKR